MKPAAKQPNVTINRYVLGILIALELLMSFSFLGYIHVEPISLTIAYIPVLIAGTLLGPRASALVALFFGLASMWKASASYVLPTDQLFSPMLSTNPIGSVLLSVGSRVLFGLVIGLLYLAVRQLWHPVWGIALVSYVASTIHSFFVYSTMYLFFPQEGFRPIDAVTDFFSPRKLLANAVITAIMVLLWLAAHTQTWQQVQQRLAHCQTTQDENRYHRLSLVVMVVLTLAAALAVTVYFVHRIDYVLAGLGIDLSNIGYLDVLHLQVQFLLGIVSLMVLVVLFSALSRKYHAALAYEGKVDPLTNAMTRRAFSPCAASSSLPLASPPSATSSWWIWTT